MIWDPSVVRRSPQLAVLDLLVQVTETAVIALCAAHPALEHVPSSDQIPLERLADQVVENALATVDALDRYRLLLRELERLDEETFAEDEPLF